MSSSYHTDQRLVTCRILTFAGWLDGTLHVGRKTPIVDHLNRPDPLLRLTNVLLPGQTTVQPFFALVRSSAIAFVPTEPAEIPAPIEGRVTHETVWLFPGGIILEGRLDLHEGVRISDHLEHRTGFVALHDCTFYFPAGSGPTTVVPRIPFLALQTERAIGASELPEPAV